MDRQRIPVADIQTCVEMTRVNFSLNAAFEGVAIIQINLNVRSNIRISTH